MKHNHERWKPTDDQLEIIRRMEEKGANRQQTADAIGIGKQKLEKWYLSTFGPSTSYRHRARYGKENARKTCGIYFDCTSLVGCMKGE